MSKIWLHGNLKKLPFAFLLFRIWKSERTGLLKIRNQQAEKKCGFHKGSLSPDAFSLSGPDFFQYLASRNFLSNHQCQNGLKTMEKKRIKPVPYIMQHSLIPPHQLWEEIRRYIKAELSPVFDWRQAEFFFDSEPEEDHSTPYVIMNTLEFILEGVRKMTNTELMEEHLPLEKEKFQFRSAESFPGLALHPHEQYLLRLIKKLPSLDKVYEMSELGLEETRKMLFAFRAYKTIGPPRKKITDTEINSKQIQKFFERFNHKSVLVFRFLSKEIGPVALKILEKCIQDVKSDLHPGFHTLRMKSDGAISLGATPSTPVGLPGAMSRQEFLNGLNEILNAEILVVKKTLGNEYESSLVKSLKSIGNEDRS